MLIFVKLRNQQAQGFAAEVGSAVTKHEFNGRIHGLDDAALRVNGHQAIHHRIENGLHQCRTVAQVLLHRVFVGDIAKHQHRTHHLAVGITNRGATVGNVKFARIAGNQHRVISQALNGAMCQNICHRDFGQRPGVFVDNVKYFIDRLPKRLRLGPAGQRFSDRVKQGHARSSVSGNHGIANRVERDPELLLSLLQALVDLRQQPVAGFPGLQQMQRIKMNLVFDMLPRFLIDQISKHHGKQRC